jgi:hypothetical protein
MLRGSNAIAAAGVESWQRPRTNAASLWLWLWLGVLVLLAVWFVLTRSQIAFVPLLALLCIPVLSLGPAVLIGLAVAAPWLCRIVTTTGLAPRAGDFLDFPLVTVAFVSALASASMRKTISPYARRFLGAVAVACGAIMLSWIANPSPPTRLLAAMLLALQPFLLIGALVLAPASERMRRFLIALVIILGAIQYPFAWYQFATIGATDHMKGTLLQAGAGHHVMAGGLMLVTIVVFATARSAAPKALAFLAAVVTTVAADAKTVLFVSPIGVTVFMMAGGGKMPRLSARLVRSAVAVVTIAAAILWYPASQIAWRFIQTTLSGEGGKPALIAQMAADFNSHPSAWLVGFGPGETVSRFAFLTTPLLLKEGSPAEQLGLRPGLRTLRYRYVAEGGTRFSGASSFLSAQSSLLGILGDYGLIGVAAFGLLIVAVVGRLRRVGTPLGAAALAGWAMLVPLAMIFDWMEQPPFMLMLALITGLALTEARSKPLLARRGVDAPRALHAQVHGT